MIVFKRKTIVSEKVLEILKNRKKPICISQLEEHLKKVNLTPNKTTLYRIMEKLKTKKIIHEIIFKNGVAYFELTSHHHHHHFFCDDCEMVYCLEHCHLDQHQINVSQLLPNHNFKVSQHEFQLYGTCEPCNQIKTKD